jgi:hypothetical protein
VTSTSNWYLFVAAGCTVGQALRGCSCWGFAGGGRTLTRELVLHAIAKSSGRLRVAPALDVSAEDKTLAKQTHLHLNGMRISRLDTGLKGLNKLETLYLYDNRLQGGLWYGQKPSTCDPGPVTAQ